MKMQAFSQHSPLRRFPVEPGMTRIIGYVLFKHYSKWTVVNKAHLHIGTEFSGFDDSNFFFALFNDVLIKLIGECRVTSSIERRTIALIAIGIQRKLGYEQKRTADILDGEVRLSVFVGKDAERKHFLDEAVSNLAGIALAYANQYKEPLVINFTDGLTININLSLSDSLDEKFHNDIFQEGDARSVAGMTRLIVQDDKVYDVSKNF